MTCGHLDGCHLKQALMALNNSIKIFLAVVTPILAGTTTTFRMQIGAAICLSGGALYSFFQMKAERDARTTQHSEKVKASESAKTK